MLLSHFERSIDGKSLASASGIIVLLPIYFQPWFGYHREILNALGTSDTFTRQIRQKEGLLSSNLCVLANE